MLDVLRDTKAPATARAQAARIIVDLEREDDGGGKRNATEMTVDEIDEEIAAYQQGKH